MATGRFRVRQATPVDLPEIARVQAAGWRETYPGTLEDWVFDEHEAEIPERVRSWEQDMLLGAYFWVVLDSENDDAMVGFSRAGAAREPDAPQPLELWHLYLLQVAQGSGVANHLLTMTIGDAPAYLWVWQPNERAQAFYRRHGFELDGGTRPFDGGMGFADLRMVRG